MSVPYLDHGGLLGCSECRSMIIEPKLNVACMLLYLLLLSVIYVMEEKR